MDLFENRCVMLCVEWPSHLFTRYVTATTAISSQNEVKSSMSKHVYIKYALKVNACTNNRFL
jgi:hypothetical protein